MGRATTNIPIHISQVASFIIINRIREKNLTLITTRKSLIRNHF